MHILLLSAGGGGGNILRSVKATFRRDVAVTQKTDPKYAERLRRAVTTRFLDTNQFALSDVPKEERVIIGARTTGRLGARHDPDVARHALHESRRDVEELIGRHSIIVLVGTGGKGTGSGTMFPLAQMAREQKKLVIPIFVRPSFERHEVDKRHYDNATTAVDQFDAAGIRLIEILNDRGYAEHDPQPQPVVWERMNLPIAHGLRGLIYVLWDLSQVDPSDLSILFAGQGRLRIGYGEIDPPEGGEPSDAQVERAARQCCDNPYYAFRQPAGTSLVCIQGDWSNLVDAKIKGGLAAAMGADALSPYSPLYARAVGLPRPWGVTALFAEYTGTHAPLDVDWRLERAVRTPPVAAAAMPPPAPEPVGEIAATPELEFDSQFESEFEPESAFEREPGLAGEPAFAPSPGPDSEAELVPEPAPFATFWEFAVALNRSSPAALALAGNGAAAAVPIDPIELRRLLGTLWFRSVLARLSRHWRDRMLETLVGNAAVADHAVRVGRKTMRLQELSFEQLQEIRAKTLLPDDVQADLDLLITVGRFWGPDAVKRFEFVAAPARSGRSMMEGLLDRFR
jgi:cell division GTPase FtsZ